MSNAATTTMVRESVTQYKTPGGEELVIMPRADYEKLIEDAIDIALARQVQEDVANGDDEYLPAEFVNRLLDGDEHPVKVWREYRGLKQAELAQKAEITAPMLSNIESKKTEAGLRVYIKLAKVLGVDIDDLVPTDIKEG